MSRPIPGGQFQPKLTGRFHFQWQGQEVAIVDLQVMPGTSPVTTVMQPCTCKKEDCLGYRPMAVDPMQALLIMGKAITELLDERDARERQQDPGVN